MPDDARPLTEKGIKRMRQIARGSARSISSSTASSPARCLAPARRPRSSRDAFGAKDRLETSNVLQTGSDAATIERWLRDRAEARLMLVGHNPTLSELVSLLVVGARMSPICELKKGGIAALTKRGGPSGSSSCPGSRRRDLLTANWGALDRHDSNGSAACRRSSDPASLSDIAKSPGAAGRLIGLVSQSSSAMF